MPLRSLPQLAGRRRDAVSPETLAQVAPIVDAVRTGGEAALREFAQRFGDVQPGAQLFHDRAELDQALMRLPTHERARLERVAERIQLFAEAQRAALCPVTVPVPLSMQLGWPQAATRLIAALATSAAIKRKAQPRWK